MLSKISLGINVLLVVAVAYLFFRLKPSAQEPKSVDELAVVSAFSDPSATKAPTLAYVNGDSLNEKYRFIKDKSQALEASMKIADKRVQDEIKSRQAEWDQNVAYAQSKKLSNEEQAIIQQTLDKLQAEIEDFRQQETDALLKKEENLQKELQARVEKYLVKYSEEKGIDFVVNYQPAINIILHANKSYDITHDVIEGLNAEYELEKAEAKK